MTDRYNSKFEHVGASLACATMFVAAMGLWLREPSFLVVSVVIMIVSGVILLRHEIADVSESLLKKITGKGSGSSIVPAPETTSLPVPEVGMFEPLKVPVKIIPEEVRKKSGKISRAGDGQFKKIGIKARNRKARSGAAAGQKSSKKEIAS